MCQSKWLAIEMSADRPDRKWCIDHRQSNSRIICSRSRRWRYLHARIYGRFGTRSCVWTYCWQSRCGILPIAGGESLKSRYEFANRLADRVFDIIQPDIVNAGGVSEMFKIGHMANAFGVHFHPHFWGTGISLSATLHVVACLPSNPPSDCPEPYINQSVVEFDPRPIRFGRISPPGVRPGK